MLAQPEQEDCGGENEVMSSLKSGDMGVGAHTHTHTVVVFVQHKK